MVKLILCGILFFYYNNFIQLFLHFKQYKKNMFKSIGIKINKFTHLSPTEAYDCSKKGAVFIDVREEFMSHVKTFDVPEIQICPLKNLSELITKLEKDKYLIFVDATGVKSKPAMEFASQNGFTKIANLAGGLLEWERDGLPTLTYQKIKVSGRNKCEFLHKGSIK